jgi:hypothetical protein
MYANVCFSPGGFFLYSDAVVLLARGCVECWWLFEGLYNKTVMVPREITARQFAERWQHALVAGKWIYQHSLLVISCNFS